MKPQSLFALPVVLLAMGCTMAPHYQRPLLPVANSFSADTTYANQSSRSSVRSANGQPAADIGWRQFFVDPRLKRLIEIALSNNRDLRVSVLNIAAARSQFQITRSELFPTIAAVASGDRQRQPNVFSPVAGRNYMTASYSVGLSASWEIDLFGRVQSLRDQALATYFATAQARKAAEISLVSQVADQYLALLAADDELKVTDGTLRTGRESYAMVKLAFDNGTGSELDMQQARTVVEAALANHQAQVRTRAQAINALVLLIGEPLPDDLPAGLPLDAQDLLVDIPAGLPSDLLARRPDIVEAEQNLLSANANIGAARAAFFPRISLTGAFGSASTTLTTLFKAGTGAWSFAPQIVLPVFEGQSNVANLNYAYVQRDIHIAEYEKSVQVAFREVSDGLVARGTYDEQIAALERNERAQRRRLELSDLRYRHGTERYLSVLTAQTDLYSAQQQLIYARLARWTNLVDLYRALGGGWTEQTGDPERPADVVANVSGSAVTGSLPISKSEHGADLN
ncbi:efflux transporter outer membrane subunit [Paraburkholderia caribensis]|nr:efflux transporter outer membrane subunit [Paraburkholderia caribensis]